MKWQKPEMIVLEFESNEVITTSGNGLGWDEAGGNSDSDGQFFPLQ